MYLPSFPLDLANYCYACLPFAFDSLLGRKESIVVVITPLTAILFNTLFDRNIIININIFCNDLCVLSCVLWNFNYYITTSPQTIRFFLKESGLSDCINSKMSLLITSESVHKSFRRFIYIILQGNTTVVWEISSNNMELHTTEWF